MSPRWPTLLPTALLAAACATSAPSPALPLVAVSLNPQPLALPPGGCRAESDCDAPRPHCFLQVGPVCGGAAARPCDCKAGEVPEGDVCGRCRCVPDCRTAGAELRRERQGQECDRETGAWRPVRCDLLPRCEPHFVCAPKSPEADPQGCVRRSCSADLDCPEGSPCVFGRCFPAFGTCLAELPSPPP